MRRIDEFKLTISPVVFAQESCNTMEMRITVKVGGKEISTQKYYPIDHFRSLFGQIMESAKYEIMQYVFEDK